MDDSDGVEVVGGRVQHPRLGMVGERGPEWIIPLSRLSRWPFRGEIRPAKSAIELRDGDDDGDH